MKIPEPLFKLINLIVHLLLRSPIHVFFSESLLVIGFEGRKTGKKYKTPVRYIRSGEIVQCFTSKSGKWWKNVAAAGQATLLIKGDEVKYSATVATDEPAKISLALKNCLTLYPQDASYHDIALEDDGRLNERDFENALSEVVLIELTPMEVGI